MRFIVSITEILGKLVDKSVEQLSLQNIKEVYKTVDTDQTIK